MNDRHQFRVVAWWSSGQTGLAKSNSAPNAIHFTAPAAFGGMEGRWTPEDLLLCALASCFTTTFQTLAEHSNFEYTDLEVVADAIVNKARKGYSFDEVVIRPHLRVVLEQSRRLGLQLLEKTNELCMISRALAITPKIEFNVEVRVAETV
jgi:organic hydroperoxide reductase OsmC/OhrA